VEPNQKTTEPIRVLLVEDEILVNEWVTQSLSEQGFAVQSVTNAADALGHLASDTVDVLFTDINLPGKMDGAALALRARELLPNLPVIYASARATMLAPDAPDARVPGAIIVPKPYEPELVGRLLMAALRQAATGVPV
jgi:two-component system, response regulator PdtaR